MKRRDVIKAGGAALLTGLAGCNTTSKGPDNTNPDGDTDSPNNANISVSISTEAQPSQLPSIWTDSQSIEDFQAQFSVQSSGQPAQVTVSNGKIQLNQESQQWNEDSVTVQPGQMKSGQQEFKATASRNGTTAEDTAQASKNTPGNYKIDVIPQKNGELRNTIQEKADEQNYLQEKGGFITQDPTLDTYSSHEALSFDKLGVDLTALEWRHDNDYQSLAQGSPEDSKEFIESIGNDTGNPRIEAIKSGDNVTTWYPNGNFEKRQVGHFDYEKFANAETLGGALDGLHSYYLNWQALMTDNGPISSEDFIYAPVLEQAIEQKNQKDLEVHAWDFDLDEHGNGLIYGKNADGSDELRIMETITNPITTNPGDKELHPLVEDSGYLTPGNEGYQTYWHPLRFGWEGHSNSQRWDFEGEKRRAAEAIKSMSSSTLLSKNTDKDDSMERTSSVAATTEYIADFTEKLRTYNQNNADFQELHNQAKIMDKLMRDDSKKEVIYGDTENPQYAVVEDESLIEDVWQDEQGHYDDFNQFLRDNPSYSMSTEDIDATLEGEEIEEGDLGQQTLAGA